MENILFIARAIVEIGFGNENMSIISDHIARPYVEYQGFLQGGMRSIAKTIRRMHEAFPDIEFTLRHVNVAGDVVTSHYIVSGTHLGSFLGHLPSGLKFSMDIFSCMRFENRRVVEHWGAVDIFDLLGQLRISKDIKADKIYLYSESILTNCNPIL